MVSNRGIKDAMKHLMGLGSVSLIINIFVCITQVFNILDNDLIRELIDGEFEWKKSTPIAICAVSFDIIIFIASNIIYRIVMSMKTKITKSIYFDEADDVHEIKI